MMGKPKPDDKPELPPGPLVAFYRKHRLLFRAAVIGVFAFVFAPYVLTPVFLLLDPPASAYMARQRLMGHPVRYVWRDLDQISDALVLQVIVSEDSRFCQHTGVDWDAIDTALTSGGKARGASTLSMQTAKNLFLWNRPASIRKVFEIPLATYMDLVLGKRRIMEIYLNIAEWGPGIYGAEAAARHHFGKTAAQLTLQEAAQLAAALPNPKKRNAGEPGPSTVAIAGKLRKRAERETTDAGCVIGADVREEDLN